jgi:hypothetical protein
LIGPSAVLTSRSCASHFESGYYNPYGSSRFAFAVGADPYASGRHFEVVHISYPASGDLAVVHLAEAVTGVTPFPLAILGANHVGQKFATLGYGSQSAYGERSTRRAGALTLRGLEGRLYELAFGSFEEFFADYSGYPGTGGVGGSGGFGGSGQSPPPPAVDAGTAGFAGAGGFPSEDGGGWGGGGWGGSGGSGGEDWYREQALQLYNGTLLEPTEAYAGGAEGDAQPCHGDEGGPLARNVNGQVRLFGVMSRLVVYCQRGAVYTRLTPELRDFVAEALRWRDPCEGVSRLGQCAGSVAVRCTDRAEGERRVVRFDCSLLAQTCVSPPGSEVTCSD